MLDQLPFGGGFYAIAVIGTVLALIVLFILGKVEAHLLDTRDQARDQE